MASTPGRATTTADQWSRRSDRPIRDEEMVGCCICPNLHRPSTQGLTDLRVAKLVALQQAVFARWTLVVVAAANRPIAAGDSAAATESMTGFTPNRQVIEQALTIATHAGWVRQDQELTGVISYSTTQTGQRLLVQLLRPATCHTVQTPNAGEAPARSVAPMVGQRKVPLTVQQQNVAVLVACGLTSREVAARLGCRPRTVDNHVAHILTKLGLRSRHELARDVAADPHLRGLIRLTSAQERDSPR
jgi:DNA-binding CsgD family transcriptional regulator